MTNELQKPIIGFTCGDLNGIGLELIIKTLSENKMVEICVPVVFANSKSINFYRKTLPEARFEYTPVKDLGKLNPRQVNIYNSWEEDVQITPGELNEIGGKYALLSLQHGVEALKNGLIDGLVTAPIHKKNIQSASFQHSGHTPYLKEVFGTKDVVMLMTASNMRVGLVTEHLAIKDVAKHITKESIISKLSLIYSSMQKDFGIDRPKIAVLGLNPHTGDDGLIGDEEEKIIKPAIKDAKHQNMLVYGPYSADAFFAREQYSKFDAVLAMYHDQGLIPFKSLAVGEGINYTAGLPAVRTSPDHGTAYDIAGKGIADASSFFAAIYTCIDIIRQREFYAGNRENPMKKVSARVLANAVDERLEGNM